MKMSKSEKCFQVFNYVILTLAAIVTLYPLIYVLSASISDPQALSAGKVFLLPKGFKLDSYREVIKFSGIWTSYLNSIFYTAAATLLGVVLTVLGAYPLSKKRFRGRKFFTIVFSVVMWFHVGMIPYYLNLKNLSLLNSRLGIILIFCISAFYLFIMRSAFEGVPETLEESAKIDGANDIIIAFKIYMPLVKPSLITIGLYYMVSKWNAYIWPMILLKDDSKIPLQVILQKIIVDANVADEMGTVMNVAGYSKETLIYATIAVAIIPMIIVYPFAQKYFTRGMMVGAVKG